MKFSIEKIKKNSKGVLYKCYLLDNNNNNKHINLVFESLSTLFGIEYIYGYKYIKWKLNLNSSYNINLIKELELFLKEEFPQKDIKSVLIEKNNYPLMLNTKYIESKTGNIIESDKGEVPTITEFIEIGKLYNLEIILENVFVGEKYINYSLIIKKISQIK